MAQKKNKPQAVRRPQQVQGNKAKHTNVQPENFWSKWAWAIIGVLTLFAFIPAFNNEFVNWDDAGYVIDCQIIRGLDAAHLKLIFTKFIEGNYHPLTMLSLAIDYHFSEIMPDGKVAPFMFHVVNVLFHTINVILVFVWLRLLTGSIMLAAITALFFGIHPMHVESVAWVSERKDVLHTFFFLLSLYCYTLYAKANTGINKNYLLALVLFILACLSKGQAVSLALVVILIDYYLNREQLSKKVIFEKIPFFLIALTFGIVAVVAQKASSAIQDNTVFPFHERIMFASYGMLAYIGKLLVPIKLSNFYPYPIKAVGTSVSFEYYVYPILVLILLYAIYRAFKNNNRPVVFGFVFFLATIALVLQIMAVGSTIMSDRYSYIPYIGLFFIGGYYYNQIVKNKPQYKTLLIGVLSIYTVIFIFSTRARCDVWQSSFNLWTDCISKYKTIPVAYNNLGLVHKERAEYQIAMGLYNKAAEVDPNYQATYENRGNIYFLTQKYDDAIKDFNKAIQLKPTTEVAYNSRGSVYFNLGRYDEALADYNMAIKNKKEYPEVYRNRGNVYSVKKMFKEAIVDYNTYLTFDKRLALVYYWRGLAYYNLKENDKAVEDYNTAIGLQNNNSEFYLNRSKAYYAMGNFKAALQDVEVVKSMKGNLDPAYYSDVKNRAGV